MTSLHTLVCMHCCQALALDTNCQATSCIVLCCTFSFILKHTIKNVYRYRQFTPWPVDMLVVVLVLRMLAVGRTSLAVVAEHTLAVVASSLVVEHTSLVDLDNWRFQAPVGQQLGCSLVQCI